MKKITQIIIAFFLIICLNYDDQIVLGQNLVPNPSFEDTLNCSGPWSGGASLEIAFPWFNPNSATTDYFANNNSNCGYQYYNQNPRTGNAYAGFFGYLVQTREYLEVRLDSSLQQGVKYCLSFYISRNEACGGATDRIGAYFSNDSLLGITPYNFPVQPQIETTSGILITDTLQWIEVSGEYIAQGGENYLTIGNFRDTSESIWQIVDSNNILCNHAYYYIDDVSLLSCSLSSAENHINENEIIEVHYYHDFIGVQYKGVCTLVDYTLIDSKGSIIKFDSSEKNNSNFKLYKREFHSGIYLLYINCNATIYSKKIIIY